MKSAGAALVRRYGDTDFVTGMRAYAALGVVLTHAGGAGLLAFGAVGERLVVLGAMGVHVFFVLSGFSVCHSLANSASTGQYAVKRLFRLLPPYYAVIIGYSLYRGVEPGNVLAHLAMVDWLWPQYGNTILSIEWTIPVEAWWYLAIPLMFAFATKGPLHAAVMLLAAFLSAYALQVASGHMGVAPGQYFHSPFAHAFPFALGVCAYLIRGHFPPSSNAIASAGIICAAVLLGAHVLYGIGEPPLVAILATGMIIISGRGEAMPVRLILLNPLVLLIGTVSYSVYLFHLFAINFAKNFVSAPIPLFPIAVAVSVAIACVTYLLIERPSIRLGAACVRAMQRRSLRAA